MKKKNNGVVHDSKVLAENQRSRNWCLVLYPDDPTHIEAMTRLGRGYQYVAILHDQDEKEADEEMKKLHYHIVLKFPQARWKSAIADELGIEMNYLQICRSLNGAYCYLTHFGLPHVHQYPHEKMFGPLYNEACKAMEQETDQNQRVLTLLALIKKQGFLNEWKLIELACDNGLYGDLIRMGSLISKLIEIHNNDVSSETQTEKMRRLSSEDENPFYQESFLGTSK